MTTEGQTSASLTQGHPCAPYSYGSTGTGSLLPRPLVPFLLHPLFLAHCREHAFWCKRQGGDMRPYGIGHRIGDGCSRSDDGRFTYATRTVECVLRRHFDNDTFDIGHIQGTGDLVIQKTSVDVASRLWVEHHLLCQAVAQGLRGPSLHLP